MPGYQDPTSLLWQDAGFTHNPGPEESREIGVKLLKAWGQAYAQVVVMAAPIEEAVAVGVGALVAKGEAVMAKLGGLLKTEKAVSEVVGSQPSMKLLPESTRTIKQLDEGGVTINGQVRGNSNSASQTKNGFIVSEDGTAMHTTVTEVRGSLENAGYQGTPTRNGDGTNHTLPNANGGTFNARVMNGTPGGGQYKGPRIVNTRTQNDTEYVRPNGTVPSNGTSRDDRRSIGHIRLKEH